MLESIKHLKLTGIASEGPLGPVLTQKTLTSVLAQLPALEHLSLSMFTFCRSVKESEVAVTPFPIHRLDIIDFTWHGPSSLSVLRSLLALFSTDTLLVDSLLFYHNSPDDSSWLTNVPQSHSVSIRKLILPDSTAFMSDTPKAVQQLLSPGPLKAVTLAYGSISDDNIESITTFLSRIGQNVLELDIEFVDWEVRIRESIRRTLVVPTSSSWEPGVPCLGDAISVCSALEILTVKVTDYPIASRRDFANLFSQLKTTTLRQVVFKLERVPMYCLYLNDVVPWSHIDSTLTSGRFPRLERVSFELKELLEDDGETHPREAVKEGLPALHGAGLLSVFVRS
ncbi:hypothetical protein C8Q74DRAFT_756873 [Fomes fomentarius]|nr:hypothetical protein C8Q74DRAFT_756873 [Fomes fomentarius]